MCMYKNPILQPDLVLGSSVLNLSLEIIRTHDLKGLILDVDETLLPMNDTEVSEELAAWLAQIKEEVSIWLVSNNPSKHRIASIAESLKVPYTMRAAKPSRRKLREAVEAMNLPAGKVGMVGDRLLTDVLAGNRLGMFTILVEPMTVANKVSPCQPIRHFELWLSRVLGVSLEPS